MRKRSIIKIDEAKCNGCGLCIPACVEGALQIIEGKARLIKESYCDGLGACLGKCPQDAITLEKREAEPFDEKEVLIHMEKMKDTAVSKNSGCPSTIPHQWNLLKNESLIELPSFLSHWPIKLNLVSPGAPYFQRDELVMATDCVPFAYGNFHKDFLDEKTVVTGCPKFDDLEHYEEKIVEILTHSDIKKIIVVRMEVPCCSGWLTLANRAVAICKKDIEVEERIVSIQGKIL